MEPRGARNAGDRVRGVGLSLAETIEIAKRGDPPLQRGRVLRGVVHYRLETFQRLGEALVIEQDPAQVVVQLDGMGVPRDRFASDCCGFCPSMQLG